MSVEALLDHMFPADARRRIPGFRSSGAILDAPAVLVARIECLFAKHANADINATLKVMRRAAPDEMAAFTIAALEAYYSAPPVVEALRPGPAVLFPHARSLPEIDYDLLEPVFLGAEIGDAS
ncbi:hypothetical protein [Ruegeria arenilitoris]|uniref:hypothetical protein n=1 Tax=Ruegeria arenilitoris TaxID=1173585 RepID=UPI001C967F49|nr:hypothetical protein [Ruegeria arenilitoris]MBY6081854.1 hypothetical protein [Ruegeria arenilitoris]